MFTAKKRVSVVLALVLLLTSISATTAHGATPVSQPRAGKLGLQPAAGDEIGNVTIYQGQEAIERYAQAAGLSVKEAEKIIKEARKTRKHSDVMPMSHIGFYIPNCTNPPNGSAVAMFDTTRGAFTVQFHGNRLWVSGGNCTQDLCAWFAQAGLPFAGDWISMYSVSGTISWDINHWCAGGITAIPGQ